MFNIHSKTTVDKDYGAFSFDKEKKYQNKIKAIQEFLRTADVPYDDFAESSTSTISSNQRANRLKSYYHKLDVKLYEYKVSSGVNVEFQTRVERYESDINWLKSNLDLLRITYPSQSLTTRTLTIEEQIVDLKSYRYLLEWMNKAVQQAKASS